MADVPTCGIPEFDLSELKPDVTVCVVGKRHSGKTRLMLHLVRALRRRIDYWVLFCPTENTRREFRRHICSTCLYDDFENEFVQRIIEFQQKLAKRRPVFNPITKTLQPLDRRRIGLILDDCMADNKKITSGGQMKKVALNGRHELIMSLVGTQYIMNVEKCTRENTDIWIVFPVSGQKKLKQLIEEALNCFSSTEELENAFKALGKYEALVYDRRAHATCRPYLFYIKADAVQPPFLAGCSALWRMHYEGYIPNQNNTDSEIMQFIDAAMGKVNPKGAVEGTDGDRKEERDDDDDNDRSGREEAGGAAAAQAAGGAGMKSKTPKRRKATTIPAEYAAAEGHDMHHLQTIGILPQDSKAHHLHAVKRKGKAPATMFEAVRLAAPAVPPPCPAAGSATTQKIGSHTAPPAAAAAPPPPPPPQPALLSAPAMSRGSVITSVTAFAGTITSAAPATATPSAAIETAKHGVSATEYCAVLPMLPPPVSRSTSSLSVPVGSPQLSLPSLSSSPPLIATLPSVRTFAAPQTSEGTDLRHMHQAARPIPSVSHLGKSSVIALPGTIPVDALMPKRPKLTRPGRAAHM
jgi:hypothetical protein